MQILENISLKPYHTFGIDVAAKEFARFDSVESLAELLPSSTDTKMLLLGGGSNMLITHDYDGRVLRNEIMGIAMEREDDESVYVNVGAGESWHRFVLYAIDKGWGGVENLSLIPGCVGASPMQNIGAYGVEIKDCFHELRAFHRTEKSNYTFSKKDCEFGYRESVFKRKYRDEFVITSVQFRLSKRPQLNTSYGAIEQELTRMGITEPTIRSISQAVINIRSSKLPDPARIGNAGSFFKNPSIARSDFDRLKITYPAMVGYENPDHTVKLAAGWLIENSGPSSGISWKGYRIGDAGVHAHQALVLVNYGNATGAQIYDLSESILQSVREKFDVTLEREVNII